MADEAKPSEGAPGAPAEPRLPMVESPKLDGADAIAAHAGEAAGEQAGEAAGNAAAAESLSRSLRFVLLAASVASAAALGSFVGSLSAAGVTRLWAGAESGANLAAAKMLPSTPPPAAKAELAALAALKADIDGATRAANSQFAKLADRIDRAEHVQSEPAAKIAHIAEAVDRLEKKVAAMLGPQTTGSIGRSASAAAAGPAAAAEAKFSDKLLPDWVVQDVRGGHALVENRYGGVFDVAQGGVLPGLGRVETIKRQDGRWVVVTARGLISSAP